MPAYRSRGYNLAGITSHRETINSTDCVAGHLRAVRAFYVTELRRRCGPVVPRRHFEAVQTALDEGRGLLVPAGDAESLLVQHHAGQAAHDHRHDHRRKELEVDATGLHRQGYHSLFEVAETHCIRDDLAADGLTMVGHREELGEQLGVRLAVELPQRVQRFDLGDRLPLALQAFLGLVAQYG